MRWSLLLLAGCDAVFGLHDVQPPPADAALDAMHDAATGYAATVLADLPLAYLPLDETSGVIAHDLVMNGPEGTILGQVVLGQAAPFRDAHFAMRFNGINSAVDLGDTFPFIGTAPYSVECWFSAMTSVAPYYEIVSKWHENGIDGKPAEGWNLFYTSVDDVFMSREATTTEAQLVTTHFDAGWHYVVATYDGSELAIYVDGVQLDAAGSVLGLNNISEHLMIGAGNGDAQGVPMLGSIAQVAIYDRALAAPQVAAHFAASNP